MTPVIYSHSSREHTQFQYMLTYYLGAIGIVMIMVGSNGWFL